MPVDQHDFSEEDGGFFTSLSGRLIRSALLLLLGGVLFLARRVGLEQELNYVKPR